MKFVALGALLGFVVSAIGFADYDQLFAMFTFADLRMFLAFVGATALSIAGYRLTRRVRPLPQRTMRAGVVVGGLLFGAGWFLCGACPGVAFAQVGQGKLWAVVTVAGVVLGTAVHRSVDRRLLHTAGDTC